MGDDALFGDSKGGDSGDKGGDDKGTVTPEVDLEALSKTIMGDLEGTLSPVMGEIGKAIGGLNTKVEQLEGRGGRADDDDGTPGVSKEIEELFSDPKGVIAKEIAEAKTKDAPLLNAMIADRVLSHTKSAEAAFDSEFGKGAYKEHMAKDVEEIVKNYPPQYLVHSDGVDSALTQVKGQKIDLLVKLKKEASDKAEALEKSSYSTVGPGRHGPDGDKTLNADEKALLAKFQEHGFEDANEKTYADMKDIPKTLSAYRKYMEGQKNAH